MSGEDPPRSADSAEIDIALQTSRRFEGVPVTRLDSWLQLVVREVAPEGDSLGVRLTEDEEMRSLNRHHRGLDRTTDVLSFDGGDSPEGRHLGDIVISVPAARRQAEERGHDLERELRVLLLHGLLHCLGHDHETDGGVMEELEAKLAGQWLNHGA